MNEDDFTLDVCYPQPTVKVSRASQDNIFIATFTQAMRQFEIRDSDIEFWMVGPISNYKLSLSSRFINDYKVEIVADSKTPFTGDDIEVLHIRFNETSFVTQNGVTLYNNESSDHTVEEEVDPDLVKLAGQGSNGLMTTSLVVIISSNLALGKSNELLWASINIIQIIYFMPLLSLYYPNHYKRFLTFLSTARVQVDFLGITKYLPRLSDAIDNNAGMPALNQRYIDIGYPLLSSRSSNRRMRYCYR